MRFQITHMTKQLIDATLQYVLQYRVMQIISYKSKGPIKILKVLVYVLYLSLVPFLGSEMSSFKVFFN